MGQYGKAKEAYENYLKVGTPTEQDYTRYAMLLYLNKDYAQSLDMVKKGLELAPENHVLKRLAMYDYLELKDYKTGLEAAATFFANPGNPDYVYLDYVYFARLLEAEKQWYNLTKHCLWISPIRKFIKISLMCTRRNVIFRKR